MKRYRHWFALLIFLFGVSSLYAQNANTLLKKGIQEYESGNFKTAAEYLEQVITAQPNNIEAKLYASRSYLNTYEDNSAKALQYLTSLQNNTDATEDPSYFMLLADAYFKQRRFENANSALDKANINGNTIEDITYLRNTINNANSGYSAPRKGIVVKNLGNKVNSAGLDYSAVMENDHRTILFTSRREQKITQTAADGYNYELIYKTTMNDDDEWQVPVVMDTEVSSKRHDATVQLIKSENKIVFYNAGDLYISEYEDGEWEEGSKIKEIASVGNEPHCFIADNGSIIYFSSDFGTQNEDLDLFYIKKDENGKWTAPEPLTELNTPYDDDAPYIDEKGNFYFSSKGHNSMGGYDVFQTKFDSKNKTWQQPRNMRHPINSVSDDIYFNISGKYAYLSSSRAGGEGSLDIYGVYMFDQVKLEGKVLDEASNPVTEALITMTHEGHSFETYTDVFGRYQIFVPFDEDLDVKINKDNQEIYSNDLKVNLSLRDENKNEYNFLLGQNQMNADKDGNSNAMRYFAINDENNVLLRNSGDAPPVESGLAVVKRTEETNTFNRPMVKETDPNNVIFEEVSVFFEINDIEVDEKYYENLDRIVMFLKDNPATTLEIAGHTDATGSKDYNFLLSARRAEKVADYLSSKGISEKRLIVVSYGKSLPVISTDDINPKNRRVVINIK
ncbi:OmpA family protein [Chondrinema litorale]|uniref:OmpA family protein n=1 Tax=Chondrinema litorale TaxID=2994555 RepID=UPI0025426CA3|nr:OmpA family protein [Chondrinema litorale]UZR93661.1 OmpA family protein [Chondrinema litorale]